LEELGSEETLPKHLHNGRTIDPAPTTFPERSRLAFIEYLPSQR